MSKKVVLVTGASRGIGAACALRLGKAGYRVALHYRSQEQKAQEIAGQLENALTFKFDLSETGSCEQLINLVKNEMGSLDILVNNAGISIDQLLPIAKEDAIDQMINTNLKPIFLLSKYASKVMLKQKSGRIINISSVVGFTGNAGQSIYAATKSAIVGFSKSIALELAKKGILVNAVAPGFIESDMTQSLPEETKRLILEKIPLQRMGTTDEVAKVVEFLASDNASYITGSTIHVNGGMYTT